MEYIGHKVDLEMIDIGAHFENGQQMALFDACQRMPLRAENSHRVGEGH